MAATKASLLHHHHPANDISIKTRPDICLLFLYICYDLPSQAGVNVC